MTTPSTARRRPRARPPVSRAAAQGHLRERPVAPADRDHRVARGRDRQIARVADPGDDDVVGPRVRAASRRSPGRIAIVAPPAAFAPRWAAAMTSPRPPVTTVQPRSARSRPTSSAAASHSRAAPDHRNLVRHARWYALTCERRDARSAKTLDPRRWVRRRLRRRGCSAAAARRSSSRENFMLYTPLLPEAASGTLEPRHVVVPAAPDVPARRARPREIDAHDEQAGVVHRRRPTAGPSLGRLRAARGRARRDRPRTPGAGPRRARHRASRTSPTRSPSATAFCASLEAAVVDPSRDGRRARARPSSSSAPATRASRRSPS